MLKKFTSENGATCVLLSEEKWKDLNHWMTDKIKKEDEQKKLETYQRYLRTCSNDLVAGRATKKKEAFKRIIENHNKKEEKINKDLEEFSQIRENKIQIKDELLDKYQRNLLLNKSPSLELTKALRASAMLKERQYQVDLRKKIEIEENSIIAKENKELVEQMKTADLVHKEKQKQRIQQKNELRACILKQRLEKTEKENKERKETMDHERMSLYKMEEENNEIKKREKEQEIYKKKKLLEILKRNVEFSKHKQLFNEKEESEIYKVNKIINDARAKRDCLIKAKMKKKIKDKQNHDETTHSNYFAKIKPIQPDEETIYQNGVRKYQKEFEQKKNEKTALMKRQAEEKIQNYKDEMKRKNEKIEEEIELKKLEKMEALKKIEALKQLDKLNEEKDRERKNTYREKLFEQIKVTKELRENEKKLEDKYILNSFEKKDDKFVEYAEEVIQTAEENNWPMFPIVRAIQDYKKQQNIVSNKKKQISYEKSKSQIYFQESYRNIPSQLEKKFVDLDQKLQSLKMTG